MFFIITATQLTVNWFRLTAYIELKYGFYQQMILPDTLSSQTLDSFW